MKMSGPYHPKLEHEGSMLYLPTDGAVATGSGIGPPWATGAGVVSHPAPTAGFTTQFPRTRYTSVAVTANQHLGAHMTLAEHCRIWRGNAVPRGGFHFTTRFMVHAIPNNNIRFFAGLSTLLAAGVAQNTSAALANATVGLWCETGDNAVLHLLSSTGGAFTKTALSGNPVLTAGTLYEFVMIDIPNQGTVVCNLINVGTDALIVSQNVGSNLPGTTVFLAPQVGLSNAANVAGGDTALDIISIYARPNLRLIPLG